MTPEDMINLSYDNLVADQALLFFLKVISPTYDMSQSYDILVTADQAISQLRGLTVQRKRCQ